MPREFYEKASKDYPTVIDIIGRFKAVRGFKTEKRYIRVLDEEESRSEQGEVLEQSCIITSIITSNSMKTFDYS